MKRCWLIVLMVLLCCSIFGRVCSQDIIFSDPNKRIGFTWDANTEADLAGYRLYTDPNISAFADPNFPRNVVKVGMDIAPDKVETCIDPIKIEGVYYFVMTAFDTGGFESGPSEDDCWCVINFPPASPKGFGCFPGCIPIH